MTKRKSGENAIAQIQSAARDIFTRCGYTKTTIREIASAVGLSPGTIYHYFPDGKRELFDGLFISDREDFRPDQEQRRKKILSITTTMLCEKGYNGFTMGEIAREAGISKPTLYQFFENKEYLQVSALHEATALLTVSRLTHFSPDMSIRQIITEISRRFTDAFKQPVHRELLRIIISESKRHPEIRDDFLKVGPYMQYDLITNYFREQKHCDEETLTNIRNRFIVFWGSLQAYVVFYRIMGESGDAPDLNLYLTAAANSFCDYIESLGIPT